MKVFLETAALDPIRQFQQLGIIDGVSLNFSGSKTEPAERSRIIRHACKQVDGPVFVQTRGTECAGMLDEGRELVTFGQNVVISVPTTLEGLLAIKTLSGRGIETNAARMFSPQQALLAAKAGATYLSLPLGLLDGGGQDGLQVLQDCVDILHNDELTAQLLATNLQSANQFVQAALSGVDAATVNPDMLLALVAHPLSSRCPDEANNT